MQIKAHGHQLNGKSDYHRHFIGSTDEIRATSWGNACRVSARSRANSSTRHCWIGMDRWRERLAVEALSPSPSISARLLTGIQEKVLMKLFLLSRWDDATFKLIPRIKVTRWNKWYHKFLITRQQEFWCSLIREAFKKIRASEALSDDW